MPIRCLACAALNFVAASVAQLADITKWRWMILLWAFSSALIAVASAETLPKLLSPRLSDLQRDVATGKADAGTSHLDLHASWIQPEIAAISASDPAGRMVLPEACSYDYNSRIFLPRIGYHRAWSPDTHANLRQIHPQKGLWSASPGDQSLVVRFLVSKPR